MTQDRFEPSNKHHKPVIRHRIAVISLKLNQTWVLGTHEIIVADFKIAAVEIPEDDVARAIVPLIVGLSRDRERLVWRPKRRALKRNAVLSENRVGRV